MAKRVVVTYAIAAAILSVGLLFQLPGFDATTEQYGDGRLSALEDDPNFLAVLLSIGAVSLVGLYLDKTLASFTKKVLLAVLLMPILVMIVNTGSRGGILAFIVGCSIFLLPYARSRRKLGILVVGAISMVAVVFMVARNPDISERWKETYYEGNISGRETIYGEILQMFSERPVFGWQPINFWYELGRRLGTTQQKDAHNLLLHLLGEGGLLGTSVFVTGLWFCGLGAWRARQGSLGLLPLALFWAMISGNMSITGHLTKPFWLVMALTVAAAAREERPRLKGFVTSSRVQPS